MTTPILDYVLEKLGNRERPWTVVARETEIPYDTLKKIARRVTPNPGVLHVQRLHDYFRSLDAEKGEEDMAVNYGRRKDDQDVVTAAGDVPRQ